MSAVTYAPAYYGDYTFPTFAEVLGWLMVCSPLACVIIGFVVQICRYGVSISNIVCFLAKRILMVLFLFPIYKFI